MCQKKVIFLSVNVLGFQYEIFPPSSNKKIKAGSFITIETLLCDTVYK